MMTSISSRARLAALAIGVAMLAVSLRSALRGDRLAWTSVLGVGFMLVALGGLSWIACTVPVFEVVSIMQLGRDLIRLPLRLRHKKGEELGIRDGMGVDREGGEIHIVLWCLWREQIPIRNVIDLLKLIKPAAGGTHAKSPTATHHHRRRGDCIRHGLLHQKISICRPSFDLFELVDHYIPRCLAIDL